MLEYMSHNSHQPPPQVSSNTSNDIAHSILEQTLANVVHESHKHPKPPLPHKNGNSSTFTNAHAADLNLSASAAMKLHLNLPMNGTLNSHESHLKVKVKIAEHLKPNATRPKDLPPSHNSHLIDMQRQSLDDHLNAHVHVNEQKANLNLNQNMSQNHTLSNNHSASSVRSGSGSQQSASSRTPRESNPNRSLKTQRQMQPQSRDRGRDHDQNPNQLPAVAVSAATAISKLKNLSSDVNLNLGLNKALIRKVLPNKLSGTPNSPFKYEQNLTHYQNNIHPRFSKKEYDPTQFPQLMEVLVQARVRDGQSLSSTHITDLPEGTIVTIDMVVGRRACISKPMRGWCSLKSKFGARILMPQGINFEKIGGNVVLPAPGRVSCTVKAKVIDYDFDSKLHKILFDDGHVDMIELANYKYYPPVVMQSKTLSPSAPLFHPNGGQVLFFNHFFTRDYPLFRAQQESTTQSIKVGPIMQQLAAQRQAMLAQGQGQAPSHNSQDQPSNKASPQVHGQPMPIHMMHGQQHAPHRIGFGHGHGHGRRSPTMTLYPPGHPLHVPNQVPSGGYANAAAWYKAQQAQAAAHHNRRPQHSPPMRDMQPEGNSPRGDARHLNGNPPMHQGRMKTTSDQTSQEFDNRVQEIERRIIQHLHQRGYTKDHPDYDRYLQKAKELAFKKASSDKRRKHRAKMNSQNAQNQMHAANQGGQGDALNPESEGIRGNARDRYGNRSEHPEGHTIDRLTPAQEAQVRALRLTPDQYKIYLQRHYRKKHEAAAAAKAKHQDFEGSGDVNTNAKHSEIPPVVRRHSSVKGLIVLRGLPGSGKSTLARKLADRSNNARICTEDKYHWSGKQDGVGEYKFQPQLVFLAREWCSKEIRECIKNNVNLVILDNHNARISMYEDHIQFAVQRGYRFRIIEFVASEDLIDKYRARSYKKFPREVYVKLLKLWEKDPRTELINPTFAIEQPGPALVKKTDDVNNSNSKDPNVNDANVTAIDAKVNKCAADEELNQNQPSNQNAVEKQNYNRRPLEQGLRHMNDDSNILQ